MTERTRIIFACDESGAKGYADQNESYPGEVGVFAGILMPEEDDVGGLVPQFEALIEKFTPQSGKLHIAELADDLKETLRQDVYEVIQNSGLPCFWYAIHVAGFHQAHNEDKMRLDEAHKATASSNVKRGSPRSNSRSLHEALFEGLYGHLIAYLDERSKSDVCIEIRSDQIDLPIIGEFEKAATRLLCKEPLVSQSTGFDTDKQSVVGGKVIINAIFPPELEINVRVYELEFNPIQEGDGLVLAADVLANSLNHLFKNRSQSELYSDLNRPEAVASHPIAKNFDAFNDWGGGDLIGDRLYRHPKAGSLI